MPLVPFPTGLEPGALFRGHKRRARRDAFRDGLSLRRQPHRLHF